MSMGKKEDFKDICAEIEKLSTQKEDEYLSAFACKSREGVRLHKDEKKYVSFRPTFFRDTDRIIHSRAYSRYIDKTQVFSFFQNDHITHRVLHVQFVAKIARVIGRALRLNEDLIEAISLGHDIGHPPFGHDGESELNAICQEYKIGAFAHNAQSVRFLVELENRGEGVNLSIQVLDGILSHNGERLDRKIYFNPKKKRKDFFDEYHKAMASKNAALNITPMTLEAAVVRIADIIAYIGRDIDDARKVGLIRKKKDRLPRQAEKILGVTNDRIIDTLVKDVIYASYNKDHIGLSKRVFAALKDLKEYNYANIYFNPVIKRENAKIRHMFRYLFTTYLESLTSQRHDSEVFRHFIDGMHKRYLRVNPPARIVTDFIAGMTDKFFLNEYSSLTLPRSFGLRLRPNL